MMDLSGEVQVQNSSCRGRGATHIRTVMSILGFSEDFGQGSCAEVRLRRCFFSFGSVQVKEVPV